MKRIMFGMFAGLLLLVLGLYVPKAEGCPGNAGNCMHEDGMKHQDMDMMGGMHIWGALMSLNLDEKQKEEMSGIKNRMTKEAITKKANLDIVRMELKDILHKEPVDMKAVEAKLKQIAALKTDIHLSHIKAMEETKSKLTPEQKKQFKEHLMAHSPWAQKDSTGKTHSCKGKDDKPLEMEQKN